jgi:hypothetical protein
MAFKREIFQGWERLGNTNWSLKVRESPGKVIENQSGFGLDCGRY